MANIPMTWSRFRSGWENFWTLRKKEVFFGLVASFALIQIFRREYELRQRKQIMNEQTPQQLYRTKVVDAVKAQENPYGLKAEWKPRS